MILRVGASLPRSPLPLVLSSTNFDLVRWMRWIAPFTRPCWRGEWMNSDEHGQFHWHLVRWTIHGIICASTDLRRRWVKRHLWRNSWRPLHFGGWSCVFRTSTFIQFIHIYIWLMSLAKSADLPWLPECACMNALAVRKWSGRRMSRHSWHRTGQER